MKYNRRGSSVFRQTLTEVTMAVDREADHKINKRRIHNEQKTGGINDS